MFEKKWRFWGFIFGIWMLLGIFSSVNLYFIEAREDNPINWFTAFVWAMPDMLIWAFFTPVIALLLTRFPLERGSWKRSMLVHALVGFSFPLIHGIIDAFVNAAIYWSYGLSFSFGHSISAHITYEYFQMVIIYWLVVSVLTGIRYYQQFRERELRAAQLESQLSQAQLQALRMQLNPHYLFNSLNAVSALVEDEPKKARELLANLGDLLRTSLEGEQDNFVPLENELRFIRSYLDVERVRLGERLHVEFEIDPKTETALVPNLILQPLVENAIRHGIAPHVENGDVRILAELEGDRLILSIFDNGKGIEVFNGNGQMYEEGVGIRNTRERLKVIYGERASFQLNSLESGWTESRVTLPLQMSLASQRKELEVEETHESV